LRERPGLGRPDALPRRPAPPADFIKNRDPEMARRGMNAPVKAAGGAFVAQSLRIGTCLALSVRKDA